MAEHGYNGWKNYPTWVANLWIDEGYAYGSEAVADRAQQLVRDEIDRLSIDPRSDAASALADELEEIITEQIEERLGIDGRSGKALGESIGLERDLLGFAFQMIDWREIAEHYTAEVEIPGADGEEICDCGHDTDGHDIREAQPKCLTAGCDCGQAVLA